MFWASSRTGEDRIAYTQDPSQIVPLLTRRDRTYSGAQTFADRVLLVDSFLPFIERPAQA